MTNTPPGLGTTILSVGAGLPRFANGQPGQLLLAGLAHPAEAGLAEDGPLQPGWRGFQQAERELTPGHLFAVVPGGSFSDAQEAVDIVRVRYRQGLRVSGPGVYIYARRIEFPFYAGHPAPRAQQSFRQ